MKFFLVVVSCWLSGLAFAQTGQGVTASVDRDAERSRIRTERAFEESEFIKREAACYARFAVTDCLESLRSQRREKLDALRRQEVVLDDADRKQKAQERMLRLEGKSQASP